MAAAVARGAVAPVVPAVSEEGPTAPDITEAPWDGLPWAACTTVPVIWAGDSVATDPHLRPPWAVSAAAGTADPIAVAAAAAVP